MKERKTSKRYRCGGDLAEEEAEEGNGGTLKTKIEETQEKIFTLSDEADFQRREEEARVGDLVTLAPEFLDLEENVRRLERKRKWKQG